MSNRPSSLGKKSPRQNASRLQQGPSVRTGVQRQSGPKQSIQRAQSPGKGSPRQLKGKSSRGQLKTPINFTVPSDPHPLDSSVKNASPRQQQEAQSSWCPSWCPCCFCSSEPASYYTFVVCLICFVVLVVILVSVVLTVQLLPDTFNQRCLERHNDYRDRHHSPPLYYNATLARAAQDWTITMSRLMNVMTDPDNFDTGENVGEIDDTGDLYTPIKGEDVADYFYSQSSRYDYYNPEMSAGCCFEFTQMVWRHTTQVGCGYNVSRGQIFFSCRYFPRGNIPGQYRDNVLENTPHAIHHNTTDRIKAIHLNFTEIAEATNSTQAIK